MFYLVSYLLSIYTRGIGRGVSRGFGKPLKFLDTLLKPETCLGILMCMYGIEIIAWECYTTTFVLKWSFEGGAKNFPAHW